MFSRRAFLRMAPAAAMSTAWLGGCAPARRDDEVVVIIESSPTDLDPRVGADAQSERIGKLLFDALVTRGERFELQPGLAERWEQTSPLTYVFHLRRGVRFHDGRPLRSADVKWSFDSLRGGGLKSPKAATYATLEGIEAPDEATVVFHLKQPDASLLWNLSDGAIGVVPEGSAEGFGQNPIGTGPFRFVRAAQDRYVVIERNPDYWGERAHLERVRFLVTPDATTRVLELRKGSADAAINSISPDALEGLTREGRLAIERAPGTIYAYLAFNLRDPLLRDMRVRQAIAYAIDRETIVKYLWRGMARTARSVLPPQHWAYDASAPDYARDVARARQLLDEAGFRPGPDGVRLRLTMKTSTEESTRLLAAVFQQQLREAGVALDIRSYEFATFYADVQRGAFQMFSLRWIGGNEDPDIYANIFATAAAPPKRANRGYYSNPEVDRLIEDARAATDVAQRREDYRRIQQIVGRELPYVNLWNLDNVLVHSQRLADVHLNASGDYDFLKTARLAR